MDGLPELLARPDAQDALPRLGGMARPDGVVIVSEHYWAFAGVDGSLREGTMPTPSRVLRRLPLLRGLARLGASISPLLRSGGVAKRPERSLLLVALLAPFTLIFLPEAVTTAVGIGLTLVLGAWMLRGRTLSLHGAEHRAIAAAEERRLVATWKGSARPSRFAPRCGTNFAALVVPVSVLADRAWPLAPALWTAPALAMLSLSVTMELWMAVQGSGRRVARAFLLPGLGLQRLTTREPRLEETRVALRAVESVLARELA
jgi:uncharacterized protein YqhQ